MSFQDESRKSLKTKEQAWDETAVWTSQRNYYTAKNLYEDMKEEILRKAQRGELIRGKTTGTFDMGKEFIPFVERTLLTRSSESFEVKDLKTLDAVYANMRDMEAADGIVLGESFLHITDGDEHMRRMDKRFRRRFGNLACKIQKTDSKILYAYVAVDYECRV